MRSLEDRTFQDCPTRSRLLSAQEASNRETLPATEIGWHSGEKRPFDPLAARAMAEALMVTIVLFAFGLTLRNSRDSRSWHARSDHAFRPCMATQKATAGCVRRGIPHRARD